MKRAAALAAALAMALGGPSPGVMLADGPIFARPAPPAAPSVVIPARERRNRKLRQRLKGRAARRREAARRAKERARARARSAWKRERTPEQLLVARMTNWQRNQWARAGYPAGQIAEFAALRRRLIAAGLIGHNGGPAMEAT